MSNPKVLSAGDHTRMKFRQPVSPDLPGAFLSRMADLLGDEYAEFLASLHQPSKTGLRVNTLKISPDKYIQISPYNLSPIPWCSSGFLVEELIDGTDVPPPGKHPHHCAGLYYLQEPSAMAASEALSPQPGERVLDLAAAPGGKTTHLAGLMKNTGLLVANEIHPRRVWSLAENLERCGVINSIVTNETPQKLAEHFGEFFDRVMLDAPCSGEGMFRRSKTARKEWKPELPRSCSLRQAAILEQAARLLKAGGTLAYSTCTFSPEENEDVIARFLEKHTDFDLVAIDMAPGIQIANPDWIGLPQTHIINRAMRIWPHHSPGEGHFIAILIKGKETGYISKLTKVKLSRKMEKLHASSTAGSLWEQFARMNLTFSIRNEHIIVNGSYVYRVPDNSLQLAGLKVIHPGWWLGTIHKDRFNPSHALALGISLDQVKQQIPLQSKDPQVASFLAGESFPNPGENGWVLVTVDGYPLGWGKRVQNVIKNYYPHGLRRHK